MLTLLEEELMRRLCETSGLGLVRHTSSVIAATSGAVAIGDLSVAAGVSSTHLAQRSRSSSASRRSGWPHLPFAAAVLSINPAEPFDWADLAARRLLRPGHFGDEFWAFTGLTPTGTSKSADSSCAQSRRRLEGLPLPPIDFLQERRLTTHYLEATRKQRKPPGPRSHVRSVSVDGFLVDENDQPGPLFNWSISGDVPLDEWGS